MEQKLRIRLDIKPPNLENYEAVQFEKHEIMSIDELNEVYANKFQEVIPNSVIEKIKNDQGSVTVLSTADIIDKVPKYEFYKICEKSYRRIHYFDIEIYVNYKDQPAIEIPFQLPSHTYVLTALRAKLNSSHCDLEVISVFDHRTKQRQILTSGLDLEYKGTKFGGSKYRLYLDNALLIERFYPYDLLESQQLEENMFVDITGNYHEIRVESETTNVVYITDIAVDDTVYSNINATEYSFNFQ